MHKSEDQIKSSNKLWWCWRACPFLLKIEPSLCCFLSDIIFDVLCLIINNKERKCMNGRYYVVAYNLNQNVTQMWFLCSPWLFLEKAQPVRNLVHSVPGGAAPLGLRTYKRFRREGEEKKRKKTGVLIYSKIHENTIHTNIDLKRFIFMFLCLWKISRCIFCLNNK